MGHHFDIFFSYSRRDKHVITPMLQLLKATGRNVFLDVDAIKPGQRWPVEVRDAIHECETFVLFWCCHSARSKWVADEVVQAIRDGRTCIPIVLCDMPMPAPLNEYQWIDLQLMARHSCDPHDSLRRVALSPGGSRPNPAKRLRPKLTLPERLENIWRANQKSEAEELVKKKEETTLHALSPLVFLIGLAAAAIAAMQAIDVDAVKDYLRGRKNRHHPPLSDYDAKLVSTAVLKWVRDGEPSTELLELASTKPIT